MKSAVLLSNNYFVALTFLFGWRVDEAFSCNSDWLRLIYMMSCGKKKRESVWAQNDTFYENLPTDFNGALKYFKERDPFNPMLRNALLYEILREDDEKMQGNNEVPKLLIFNEGEELRGREPVATTYKPTKKASVLIQKLFPKTDSKLLEDLERGAEKFSGIQGFPAQWDIEEIADEKINENHRREIKKLIEKCCKDPPASSCNTSAFTEICK